MILKVKNWKLTLLACFFIGLFTCLGSWQLSRAKQKEILINSFTQRTLEGPLSVQTLSGFSDLRFYRAELTGSFDNTHTFLLDNKTYQGQIGYEVYTPFKAERLPSAILVDRGFIPMGQSRRQLPDIQAIKGTVTILGLLNLPPSYVAFGQIKEPQLTWPLRIEFVNIDQLSTLLSYSLYPYTLTLSQKDPSAYAVKWDAVTIPPERHRGYAVQWFALALTLLILSVVLNRR